MKFSVIPVLLAAVFIQNSAAYSKSCYGKNVDVTVINGIGMTGDGPSKPDPYVKIIIGDMTKTTRVIRGSRNPVWWQGFNFDNIDSNEMNIEVWDEDSGFRGSDDHLGTCTEELTYHATGYTQVECTVAKDGIVNVKYKCYEGSQSHEYSREEY